MPDMKKTWNTRERVLAVLEGRKPDRLPFVDRMELWYRDRLREGGLDEKYAGLSLDDLHDTVGMGRQVFIAPYALKLRQCEVVYTWEKEVIHREFEPVMEYFPAQWAPEHVPRDRGGTTRVEFITPVGRVSMTFVYANAAMALGGMQPLLTEHLIKEDGDYHVAEYLIESAKFVPQFEKIRESEKKLGGKGFVVPCLHRIPFQQALLEYLGEVPLFTALYENPAALDRLITVLDEKLTHILSQLSNLDHRYVEFGDNLDGIMTNPNLFGKYSLPAYQRYAEILHGQGKKMGSHTDGNLKPLLDLLAESGLDVCESFSPAPLTECTFEEAWKAWEKGPLIWGGIPSAILEERTSEEDFKEYIQRFLKTIGSQPIIVGVGDMVLGNNLMERVEFIAQAIEDHSPVA